MSSSRSLVCGCQYARAKLTVWQTVARHLEGCDLSMIVGETNLCPRIVLLCLEDLYVEDRVYLEKDGRWYPEMAVS